MPPYHIPEALKIAILAIVQGIAEFMPISSSGHLVVLNALFGTRSEEMLGLGIVLHLGTLLAILVFYRRRILALLYEDRRVIPLLIAGTIPAVVLGLYLKTYQEWLTVDPLVAGFMLTITGFILMLLPGSAPGGEQNLDEPESGAGKKVIRGKDYQAIGFFTAFLIGLAQAFAILPGISRSGTTIVAGVLLGLKRQSAATFSFLLAIPAIAGASVLELVEIFGTESDGGNLGIFFLGASIAFAVGWLSLTWLVRWLEKGKLHLFAYWVIPLGFLVVVWQLYQYISNQVV
jgi:undecaprenyl-diphosphatase